MYDGDDIDKLMEEDLNAQCEEEAKQAIKNARQDEK